MMDPVKKGAPQSPVKPPILPKPKTIKDPPLWVTNKYRLAQKKSTTIENHEAHSTSFSETVVVTKRSESSNFIFRSASNPTSFAEKDDESLDDFDRKWRASVESVSDARSFSSLVHDSTSSTLNYSVIQDHDFITATLDEISFNAQSSDSPYSSQKNIAAQLDQEECLTFHLTAGLRPSDNRKYQEKGLSEGLRCSSPSNGSLSGESTSESIQSGSYTTENDLKIVKSEKPKKNKAFLIAEELMTSEQVYVDALKLILIDFKSFLEHYNNTHNITVIPFQELDNIFKTLPQLLHLNEDLLVDMKERISNWDKQQRIANVIVKKGPFLKLYTTYMKDFECQCNYIDECCQKYPKFSKALREFESSSICKKLTLRHYMLKPVQRIPHYRLLLEDYSKHLDKSSDEYNDTIVALGIVKDVLHHANSKLKLADNFCKLLQIQSSVGNYEIIKPGRLFVKEGELKKLSRKETQPRFFILLSDCLLYTIYTAPMGLKIKYELPLSGMKVYTHPGDGTEFSIITSTRSFTLRARNDTQCNEWVKVLKETINDNINRQLTFLNKTISPMNSSNFESLKLGREAPVWVQDKSTTMCQVCTAEFTVTFRRHHCRSCGKVVCSDCSSNKAPLAYLKFHAARVCEDCYQYLLKEFNEPEILELIKNELNLNNEELNNAFENIKSAFKKIESVKKTKKYIPQRLKEVTANDRGSSMSGWLSRKTKKEWKKMWFVLKDQVLYMYKASNDVVAYDSLPVLGYTVDRPLEEEDVDNALIFRLTHAGQTPVTFLAPDKKSADMWVAALNEATVLK